MGTAIEVDGMVDVVRGVVDVVGITVDVARLVVVGGAEPDELLVTLVLLVVVSDAELAWLLVALVLDANVLVVGVDIPNGVRYQLAWGSPRHSPAVTPFHPFDLIRSK